MFVSGFMGSPRDNGSTAFLLDLFMTQLKKHGAKTETVNVSYKNILPCTGCSQCKKTGICNIDDDMETEIFPIIKKSDIIIIASPIYFYNVPSGLKTMIDRSQTLWARKYRLRLSDPAEVSRKGFMLSVGATKGSDLFDAINLTMKYFFKGIGADFSGELSYRRIEKRTDLEKIDSLLSDVGKAAEKLARSYRKKTILFTCSQNTGRSQMAAAIARNIAGDRFNIISAGTMPADMIEPEAERSMADIGLDIGFIKPESIDRVTDAAKPDYVVTINSGDETCVHLPGSESVIWQVENTADKTADETDRIRDDLKEKVNSLIGRLL